MRPPRPAVDAFPNIRPQCTPTGLLSSPLRHAIMALTCGFVALHPLGGEVVRDILESAEGELRA
jgi:hypothetical protein